MCWSTQVIISNQTMNKNCVYTYPAEKHVSYTNVNSIQFHIVLNYRDTKVQYRLLIWQTCHEYCM